MNMPTQFREPSTYAGLGVILTAIPELMATGFTSPTAWAQVIMGLIAIIKRENPQQ